MQVYVWHLTSLDWRLPDCEKMKVASCSQARCNLKPSLIRLCTNVWTAYVCMTSYHTKLRMSPVKNLRQHGNRNLCTRTALLTHWLPYSEENFHWILNFNISLTANSLNLNSAYHVIFRKLSMIAKRIEIQKKNSLTFYSVNLINLSRIAKLNFMYTFTL